MRSCWWSDWANPKNLLHILMKKPRRTTTGIYIHDDDRVPTIDIAQEIVILWPFVQLCTYLYTVHKHCSSLWAYKPLCRQARVVSSWWITSTLPSAVYSSASSWILPVSDTCVLLKLTNIPDNCQSHQSRRECKSIQARGIFFILIAEGGFTCFSSKFGHQMAPLALVANLANRWHHMH